MLRILLFFFVFLRITHTESAYTAHWNAGKMFENNCFRSLKVIIMSLHCSWKKAIQVKKLLWIQICVLFELVDCFFCYFHRSLFKSLRMTCMLDQNICSKSRRRREKNVFPLCLLVIAQNVCTNVSCRVCFFHSLSLSRCWTLLDLR